MRSSLLLLTISGTLVACGASVGDSPSRDASLPDVSLGPIDGCPSMHGPRGAWESIAVPEAFSARGHAVVLGVGDRLLIYGGQGHREINDHWLFEPGSQRWTQLPSDGPQGDARGLAVTWIVARNELFLWHAQTRRGVVGSLEGPWRALPTLNAPRTFASRAVTVNGLVFVAGSVNEGDHNEFALYDPNTDQWEPVLAPREQTAVGSYSLVLAGDEVVVWGGADATTGTGVPRNFGWRFHVPTRQWRSVTRNGAPSPRWGPSAFWTGDSMLVWGGSNGSNSLTVGGRYVPTPDVWIAMNSTAAPTVQNNYYSFDNRAVWTGNDLFVWLLANTGTAVAGRYDPRVDYWFAVEPPPDPAQRFEASTAWFNCAVYVVSGRTMPGVNSQFTRTIVRWTP